MDVCGFTLDGVECEHRGAHHCAPRARHAVQFFHELLLHTKGKYYRKPFILTQWQREDIIEPLFGTVEWSDEHECYRRQYEIAWIEIARKNGKALDVATPILTPDGWRTMGDLRPGDKVFAPDGTATDVVAVSEVWTDTDCYSVQFADGAMLTASGQHQWLVNDRLKTTGPRVVDTRELAATYLCGARGDRRYSVDVPAAVEMLDADLPVDPYIFGYWLGDGSSTKAEVTTADPEVLDDIAEHYELTYSYERGQAVTRGIKGLRRPLRELGVLGNKHVPAEYMQASARQRMELLRGLMDSDGSVIVGPNTPRVEFCNTNLQLAEAVLLLARSLGYKATLKMSRAKLYGKDCGFRYRVCWTAYEDNAPFRLGRKALALHPRPPRPTRAATNSIVSVERVPTVDTVCIQVAHESHCFLAGEALTPTHNSELLAGIMLYLLIADGEQSAEIYGAAKNRDQASLVFDVAAQMVLLSPILSKCCRVLPSKKRIVYTKTNGFYRVIAADAGGALGSNPSGVGADEILAWHDGSMWDSLRTGMGSGARVQPLLVAATTAGNDSEGFAGQMHKDMEALAANPELSKHTFVYMRNTPKDADPWDEKNWTYANPAIESGFLSLEGMRKQAEEAKRNPVQENAFRQFKLNQWVSQAVRWMPMHKFDDSTGEVYETAQKAREAFTGREAWFGLDLASRQDLCSWCVIIPADDGTVDVLWRHWIPRTAFDKLNAAYNGRLQKWVDGGWLTVTDGDVLDFDQFYNDIEADSNRFVLLGGDVDKFASEPVIQEIEKRTYVSDIFAYNNTYTHMSDGMKRVMELSITGQFRWHGNPVARFCFDGCEARIAKEDPDLVRPSKPNRTSSMKRIDAVPAAIMAVNAWSQRGDSTDSHYNDHDLLVL